MTIRLLGSRRQEIERLKMIEVPLLAVVLAIIVPWTMSSGPGFSFCPALCSCEDKIITCQVTGLPVKLPPEYFNRLRIIPSKKRTSVVIPARAFQLSRENKNLNIDLNGANISKISANAFEGLKVINSLLITSCHIDKLETYSLSNINVSSDIFIVNTSIGTIHRLAFHEVNTSKLFIHRTNITRISTAAFSRINIVDFRLFKSNIKYIEPNAFGLWTAGIDKFKLKYNNVGSFECNEATNDTSVSVFRLAVNCTCDLVWILKNTSSFYPVRSRFQCQENPGISLLEMEDSLRLSCLNQTQTIDQSCSPREINNVGPIKSKSARQLMSASLFLINCLFIYIYTLAGIPVS